MKKKIGIALLIIFWAATACFAGIWAWQWFGNLTSEKALDYWWICLAVMVGSTIAYFIICILNEVYLETKEYEDDY